MPRAPRIEYEGAIYHVMARGNRGEAIVRSDEDCETFIKTMEETCVRTKWKTYAWVLMQNHYHWVMETPHGNLVEGMCWFQNTFTRRINSRNRLWGHLFGGRYKANVVEGRLGGLGVRNRWDRGYLFDLIDYVHLNPARAGLVGPDREEGQRSVRDYPWSSVSRGYALSRRKRPDYLHPDTWKLYQLDDTAAGRQSFVRRLDGRVRDERGIGASDGRPGFGEVVRNGWLYGSDRFRELLLEHTEEEEEKQESNAVYRSSEQARAYSEKKAERILEEGLRHFRLEEKDIKSPKKRDERRVAVAWAICEETTVRQDWIAERLNLKSATNVSQRVRQYRKKTEREKTKQMKTWEKKRKREKVDRRT